MNCELMISKFLSTEKVNAESWVLFSKIVELLFILCHTAMVIRVTLSIDKDFKTKTKNIFRIA